MARRRHPQHPGVRAGLSRGADHSPGAELPLDAEHTAGGIGRGRPQRQAQGQEPWTDRSGGAKIGYYEAPDGENEALFAADYISKYLRQGHAENGETPRAAVLYRTNSQSRLLEEAMRRYQLKYHVVGGFSFYERAEIKDMISYLKVIPNPDDSIAMQRVINNSTARAWARPPWRRWSGLRWRPGISLWGAIREAVAGNCCAASVVGAEGVSRADRGCARDVSGDVSRERGGDARKAAMESASDAKKIFSIRWISQAEFEHDVRFLAGGVWTKMGRRDCQTRSSIRPNAASAQDDRWRVILSPKAVRKLRCRR